MSPVLFPSRSYRGSSLVLQPLDYAPPGSPLDSGHPAACSSHIATTYTLEREVKGELVNQHNMNVIFFSKKIFVSFDWFMTARRFFKMMVILISISDLLHELFTVVPIGPIRDSPNMRNRKKNRWKISWIISQLTWSKT